MFVGCSWFQFFSLIAVKLCQNVKRKKRRTIKGTKRYTNRLSAIKWRARSIISHITRMRARAYTQWVDIYATVPTRFAYKWVHGAHKHRFYYHIQHKYSPFFVAVDARVYRPRKRQQTITRFECRKNNHNTILARSFAWFLRWSLLSISMRIIPLVRKSCILFIHSFIHRFNSIKSVSFLVLVLFFFTNKICFDFISCWYYDHYMHHYYMWGNFVVCAVVCALHLMIHF